MPLDGLDAWATIANGADSPREEVVHSLMVIRVGDWKLIEANGADYENRVEHPVELYNISDDPYEEVNLAASEPAKVAELQARLAAHRPFARAGEPKADIPNHPPAVYGAEEHALFGAEVLRALRERQRGNPGPTLHQLEAVAEPASR